MGIYIFLRLASFYISEVAEIIPVYAQHPYSTGLATLYGTPGDIYAQRGLACAPKKHMDSKIRICAHRTLPCGTVLLIQTIRNRKLTTCTVMDRGPYGAYVTEDGARRWVIKIHRDDPGAWRGILDMAPAVVKSMDHNGFERIRVWVLKRHSNRHKPQVFSI